MANTEEKTSFRTVSVKPKDYKYYETILAKWANKYKNDPDTSMAAFVKVAMIEMEKSL